jgi:hypothetical protein
VLRGSIPTPSGLATLAAVDESDVERALGDIVRALPAGVPAAVHCCTASPPVASLARAGFAAVSLDATLLTEADDEAIGEAVEGGVGLLLGLVHATDPSGLQAGARDDGAPARSLWRRTGLDPAGLSRVVVTPTCGLSGSSPAAARAILDRCRAVARSLTHDPEDTSV